MSVTIKDVAKEVGVAPSTVSRTLQDHPSISAETKEKVRKAMEKLGYVPNVAAQNLAKKYANTIGLVFPPMASGDRKSNPFYLEILTAMNAEASQNDVTISIASAPTTDELLQNVQLMYRQKRVDGFILLYVRPNDPVVHYLVTENIPYTVIGQPYELGNETSCVDNDNRLLGQTATDYLVSKGHQKIVFVTNVVQENVFQERYYGYQSYLQQKGLTAYPAIVLDEPTSYLHFEEFLAKEQPSAIIVIDDMFALRVMQLVQLYHYRVPDDLSFISFNHSIFSNLIHPYITSIDIQTEELGRVAVQQFMTQLTGKQRYKTRVIIPHRLIESETVVDLEKR